VKPTARTTRRRNSNTADELAEDLKFCKKIRVLRQMNPHLVDGYLKHTVDVAPDSHPIKHDILALQHFVDITPDSHPDKNSHLSNLGIALRNRFLRFGDAEDINYSILAFQRAVDIIPDDHPNKGSFSTYLGFAFQDRFKRFGNVKDINQSILAVANGARLLAITRLT
jgi:hypothetical protein